MVLKLYGFPSATCTQRVATVLHEKNVPFELIPVDITKGEQKNEEYLKKQPFGQIPVLDDDGFLVYESRAIASYIADKYADQGTRLIPTDLKAKAHHTQAVSVEMSNFNPHASNLVLEKIFKKLRGLEVDEAAVSKHASALDTKLNGYERILSTQKYLAGNELTIADLYHLPYGALLYDAGYGHLIDERPNVKRWFDGLRSRDSWTAVKDGVKGTA
ncbi:hypothetical protein APHAL10511_000623 [Amanita phalloides]|nr:hypothetical protein APHAL10511_000623 [Amanita phalloides]